MLAPPYYIWDNFYVPEGRPAACVYTISSTHMHFIILVPVPQLCCDKGEYSFIS